MTVIASLSVSLDGFYTGPDPSAENMMGTGGAPLHGWFAHDVADRHQLTADDILRPEFERTGALVMGRDSYEHAQAAWGPHPPFEMPIFVVTSRAREADVRDGSTFHFVTEGFESAIAHAQQAAAGKDVGLHGGGAVRQGLRTGLLDELQLHLVPVLLGRGRRWCDELDSASVELDIDRVAEGPGVTHLRYRVRRDARQLSRAR
ncbi:deaminase [Aeromicrobium phragmitis]|uniref:Deaminase n=1 Tax=Aeromicrobium phragmitis TaxID=2478914 RepID=A0A3L8PN89_9ACTN|nr:dihydrofolate reductase family protein [Aeromicrobium phragmitis]RLV55512.1 deaminase [Aeromicrobium phragmitis]